MCKDFECLDCPAISTDNCYYYANDFMDYYAKVQWENNHLILNGIT
jgi:hypothetical protein